MATLNLDPEGYRLHFLLSGLRAYSTPVRLQPSPYINKPTVRRAVACSVHYPA